MPLFERWSVWEYPNGLRHQAPGHEFELRTPPDYSPIHERQSTTRETDLVRDSFIIHC